MADHQDLQILVKDILEGVGAMIDDVKRETRVLIEAQDKKISAIADEVTALRQDMTEVKGRLDTLESDVKVIKAVVTSHSEEIHTLKRAK